MAEDVWIYFSSSKIFQVGTILKGYKVSIAPIYCHFCYTKHTWNQIMNTVKPADHVVYIPSTYIYIYLDHVMMITQQPHCTLILAEAAKIYAIFSRQTYLKKSTQIHTNCHLLQQVSFGVFYMEFFRHIMTNLRNLALLKYKTIDRCEFFFQIRFEFYLHCHLTSTLQISQQLF